MRILKIAGCNLASLAGAFEIDLAGGSLAGAGLFAITGETGAGKSTILDALSLALYGEYPRSGAGGQESVPDPSGQDLPGSDPRAILRRGTSSGWAEADFVGVDGRAYRARWAVRRAGQRAGGRLQEVARSLTLVADGSPVEAGKTAVRAAVERLTRLTYAQFSRTVILPQGEFDRFLLAPERERAELLERITGTQVYAAISVRVHEETEARRRALDALRARREAVPAMADADRAAAEAEAEALLAASAALAARRAELAGRVELTARLAEAEGAASRAAEALGLRRGEAAALAGDRELAARAAAADAARPEARSADEAATARAAADGSVAAAREAAEQARIADDEAAGALPALEDAERSAQEAAAAAAPAWAEAERMDAALIAAGAEAGEARRLAAAAAAAALAAEGGLTRIDGEAEAARGSLDAASGRLGANPGWGRLAAERDRIPGLCADHARIAADRVAAAAALEAAEAMAAAAKSAADGRRADMEAAVAERDAAAGELEAAAREVAAADGPAMLARGEALDALRILVERSRDAAASHAAATTSAAAAAAERAAAASALEAARERRTASEGSRAASLAARGRAAEMADLAEGAVSREAARLRSLLVDGAPCPVCGGLAHPRVGRDGGLDDLAAAMRRNRQELDYAIAAAGDAAVEATGAIALAERSIADAARAEAEAIEEAAGAEAAHAAALGRMVELRDALAVRAPMPEGVAGGASAAALESLAAEVAAAGVAQRAASLAHARARDETDRLRLRRDGLAAKADALGRELSEAMGAAHSADLALERAGGHSRDLDGRHAGSSAILAPLLSAAGAGTSEVERDPAAARDRMLGLADEHVRLVEEAAACRRRLEELALDRAGAAVARDRARDDAASRGQAAAARDAGLDRLARERAGLLGGEATASHRGRHEAALGDARAAHAVARERRARTAGEAGMTALRLEVASAGAAVATAAAAAASAALRIRCERLGMPVEEVLRLHAVPADEREAGRRRIEEADRAVAVAEAAATTRRQDLERLRAVQVQDQEEDGAALLEAVDAEVAAAHRRSGALAQSLAEDARQRAVAAGLDADVAAADAELAVWRSVDEAVGSAGGDKFRRFAQEVTVEHLIALANRRLEAIAPRYRLARGSATALAIHAVDGDMGGEVRAARSLSGGERFLVSLALALGLAGLEGGQAFSDVLFIDEGFGSLDAESLDVAVDALETLHGLGRSVGVITHVQDMVERIPVRVRVSKRGSGRSVVSVEDGARPEALMIPAP